MAQLKRHSKKGYLKASTLLETLVSSVIIMGCFGVSLMIFEQVLNSSESANEIRAKLELRNTMLSADYDSNILIEVEQENYSGSPSMLLVTYSALDLKGETICEWQTLKPTLNE